MVDLTLVQICQEVFPFVALVLKKKALSDTEFPGRFLSYLLGLQTLGMIKKSIPKLRLLSVSKL